ncbi:MAG: hypothetical protein OER95_05515 [Acidimicrobiia bacterium]|nr:hypothetical protein [Acidimicrobiia bacterium]
MKVLRLAAVLVAVITLIAGAGAAAANSSPERDTPPQAMAGWSRGQAALETIGAQLPAVAEDNGLTTAQLRQALLNDPTLAVDADLNLAYFDVLAPDETAGTASTTNGTTSAAAPPVTGPEFQLESLPGAAKTIYLDFDGHTTTGTRWNTAYRVSTIDSPPYDRNGNPDSWSAEELQIIRDSWAVVAEDFAPWNVNVTTKDPGTAALINSGGGDTAWGIRVVITDDTFANCGCGGHAYIGSFNQSHDEPTFVYNSSFVGVSEAISHEVGHTMYLAHDGTASGASYYTGHGAGDTSWAPIMGVAYYASVGQWSKQTYYNANNNSGSANYGRGADDVAVIGTYNGFGVKADDHGNSGLDATPLSGDTPTVTGLISTRSDVDVFSFSTSGGTVTFTAEPDQVNPNLDIELRIRDSGGALVAVGTDPGVLSASLTATLVAGDYTIEVDGVGVGDETVNPPVGYSDYGSLGVYTLTGSYDSTEPPPPPPPSNDALASGETTLSGTVSGDYSATFVADGVSEILTEVESGGRPRDRHDTLDHQWMFNSPGGVQTLSIVANVTNGGDLDNGISLEWSTDGSGWVALDTLTGSVDASYLLGSPTGTILVRVVDTDSTSRELNMDSIAVDFLEISGEPVAEPTQAVLASMSISTVAAGRGESHGQVTVVVENELGQPVGGAVVSFAFIGDFSDTGDATTNSSGVATFTTSSTVKKPTFEACVTDIGASGLTYNGGITCQSG